MSEPDVVPARPVPPPHPERAAHEPLFAGLAVPAPAEPPREVAPSSAPEFAPGPLTTADAASVEPRAPEPAPAAVHVAAAADPGVAADAPAAVPALESPPASDAGAAPAAAAPRVVLSARGLKKSYRMGPHRVEVLRGADLDVHEGEILAILGSSGSGKSTFLHVLGLLDKTEEGSIVFEGRDRASLSAAERASIRASAIGFVFQFYHLLPELTALENVMLPAMIVKASASERAAALARARLTLARVGLASREAHRPAQLSGGERQRVAIARALQNRPRVLLCDEPTGNLDGRTALEVRRLLWDLNAAERQTLVIVTHDASLAAQAHRVVHLVDGRIVDRPPEGPAIAVAPEVVPDVPPAVSPPDAVPPLNPAPPPDAAPPGREGPAS